MRRRHLFACTLAVMLLLGGCTGGRDNTSYPEVFIRSYVTIDSLAVGRLDTVNEMVAIPVCVVAARTYEYNDANPEGFRRYSRAKGDTAYYKRLSYWAWPGTLGPDVEGLRVYECEPDGTGSLMKRDLAKDATISYLSYDDHIYHGYYRNGVNTYDAQDRERWVKQPLEEFKGVRLPVFFNWDNRINTLCTVWLPPPTVHPARIRVEVLLDSSEMEVVEVAIP